MLGERLSYHTTSPSLSLSVYTKACSSKYKHDLLYYCIVDLSLPWFSPFDLGDSPSNSRCYLFFIVWQILCWNFTVDEFTLSILDMSVDATAGHSMFSFKDGFSGYNQTKVDSGDAAKLALWISIGNFHYTAMPFD